jgi:hypothetical protein
MFFFLEKKEPKIQGNSPTPICPTKIFAEWQSAPNCQRQPHHYQSMIDALKFNLNLNSSSGFFVEKTLRPLRLN